MTFRATVLTLYPEMFPGPLGMSLAGRGLAEGAWSLTDAQRVAGLIAADNARRVYGLE